MDKYKLDDTDLLLDLEYIDKKDLGEDAIRQQSKLKDHYRTKSEVHVKNEKAVNRAISHFKNKKGLNRMLKTKNAMNKKYYNEKLLKGLQLKNTVGVPNETQYNNFYYCKSPETLNKLNFNNNSVFSDDKFENSAFGKNKNRKKINRSEPNVIGPDRIRFRNDSIGVNQAAFTSSNFANVSLDGKYGVTEDNMLYNTTQKNFSNTIQYGDTKHKGMFQSLKQKKLPLSKKYLKNNMHDYYNQKCLEIQKNLRSGLTDEDKLNFNKNLMRFHNTTNKVTGEGQSSIISNKTELESTKATRPTDGDESPIPQFTSDNQRQTFLKEYKRTLGNCSSGDRTSREFLKTSPGQHSSRFRKGTDRKNPNESSQLRYNFYYKKIRAFKDDIGNQTIGRMLNFVGLGSGNSFKYDFMLQDNKMIPLQTIEPNMTGSKNHDKSKEQNHFAKKSPKNINSNQNLFQKTNFGKRVPFINKQIIKKKLFEGEQLKIEANHRRNSTMNSFYDNKNFNISHSNNNSHMIESNSQINNSNITNNNMATIYDQEMLNFTTTGMKTDQINSNFGLTRKKTYSNKRSNSLSKNSESYAVIDKTSDRMNKTQNPIAKFANKTFTKEDCEYHKYKSNKWTADSMYIEHNRDQGAYKMFPYSVIKNVLEKSVDSLEYNEAAEDELYF